ncbi:MAG: hypothetical protein ACK5OB_12010 [Pirellula sp.]|jgi:hypothetical protein
MQQNFLAGFRVVNCSLTWLLAIRSSLPILTGCSRLRDRLDAAGIDYSYPIKQNVSSKDEIL